METRPPPGARGAGEPTRRDPIPYPPTTRVSSVYHFYSIHTQRVCLMLVTEGFTDGVKHVKTCVCVLTGGAFREMKQTKCIRLKNVRCVALRVRVRVCAREGRLFPVPTTRRRPSATGPSCGGSPEDRGRLPIHTPRLCQASFNSSVLKPFTASQRNVIFNLG